MAEDDAPRNSPPSDDPPRDGSGAAGGPDATAEHPPLEDTPTEGPPLEATAEHPPLDETQVAGPAAPDAGPTGTGVLPPVAAEPPRWSARAQVPQHDLDEDAYGYDTWTQVEEEQPQRNLVTPALIALCVLLLAALIALGVWLALRDREPPPVTPTTPVPSSAPPTTTPPAPTTTPPASPTPPAEVVIPGVRTLTYDQAVDRLTEAGFTKFERVNEVSELPAGQVIGTNPPEGNTVRPDATIGIRVSSGPPPTTTPPPTTEAD